MTLLQILLLIYFAFVCVHLNAAGLLGSVLGVIGIVAIFTKQPALVALILLAVILMHGILRPFILKSWEKERQRNYSILHLCLAGVLLLFQVKALGYF